MFSPVNTVVMDGTLCYTLHDERILGTYTDKNGVSRLGIIDPETKAVRENVLPAANGELYDITVYAEKTWLRTLDGDLYVLSDGGFTLICEDKGSYTFGGGIWYTEEAEPVYIGTKEMPTGAPGGRNGTVRLLCKNHNKALSYRSRRLYRHGICAIK